MTSSFSANISIKVPKKAILAAKFYDSNFILLNQHEMFGVFTK